MVVHFVQLYFVNASAKNQAANAFESLWVSRCYSYPLFRNAVKWVVLVWTLKALFLLKLISVWDIFYYEEFDKLGNEYTVDGVDNWKTGNEYIK